MESNWVKITGLSRRPDIDKVLSEVSLFESSSAIFRPTSTLILWHWIRNRATFVNSSCKARMVTKGAFNSEITGRHDIDGLSTAVSFFESSFAMHRPTSTLILWQWIRNRATFVNPSAKVRMVTNGTLIWELLAGLIFIGFRMQFRFIRAHLLCLRWT